jgi:hypothetical protein
MRLTIVSFFSLCWRNVADRLQKTAIVDPIHPFEWG